MRRADRAEVVRVWADLNSIYRREDGAYEVATKYVEGLELRQFVIVTDSDMNWPGIVSGFVDRGRGKYLLVEEYRSTLTANIPIAVKCSDELNSWSGRDTWTCELVLGHLGSHRCGTVQWERDDCGRVRRMLCKNLHQGLLIYCRRDPGHGGAHFSLTERGERCKWM
jgi:hypothetical protein